jgi:hypothetical protein
MNPSIYEPALHREPRTLYLPTTGTDIGGRGLGPAWVGDGIAVVSHPALAAGFTTQFPRRRFTSAGGTSNQELGAHSPELSAWRGNAVKLGGFYFSCRFMVNAIPDTVIRFFCGLAKGVSPALNNTLPANTVGLWCDTADAGALSIGNADSGGVNEKFALSSGVTLTAGVLYDFVMIANPSPSNSPGTIVTNLYNVGTDTLLCTQNPGNRLPASTEFLAPHVALSNANHTAGGDCSLDVIHCYLRPNLRLTPLGSP